MLGDAWQSGRHCHAGEVCVETGAEWISQTPRARFGPRAAAGLVAVGDVLVLAGGWAVDEVQGAEAAASDVWMTQQRCRPGQVGPSCAACAAGKASDAEGFLPDAECADCAGGTFSGPGASACEQCPPGYTAADGGTACAECGPGWFRSGTAGPLCAACAAGEFQPEAAATTCAACAAGKVSGAGARDCAECEPGSYQVMLPSMPHMHPYHTCIHASMQLRARQLPGDGVMRASRMVRASHACAPDMHHHTCVRPSVHPSIYPSPAVSHTSVHLSEPGSLTYITDASLTCLTW